ncbi:MAG: hypothetical protein RL190_2158 [Actinomycetota bacterium]|jgi:hypothetical protein
MSAASPPRWSLVSFGDGSLGWRNAARRVVREACPAVEVADAQAYDLRRLRRDLPGFWRDHGDFVRLHERGCGYWLWKPYLIRDALRRRGGAGVVYVDAGSTLRLHTPEARRRWAEYLALAADHGLFSFRLGGAEGQWTKPELLDHLRLRDSDRCSRQLAAHFLILADRPETRDLVDAWCDTATAEGYGYLTDRRWRVDGSDSLVEHRHDQSIFSCLAKAIGVGCSIDDESWPAGGWDMSDERCPVWATRWASGAPFGTSRRSHLSERIDHRARVALRRGAPLIRIRR